MQVREKVWQKMSQDSQQPVENLINSTQTNQAWFIVSSTTQRKNKQSHNFKGKYKIKHILLVKPLDKYCDNSYITEQNLDTLFTSSLNWLWKQLLT